MTTQRGTLAIDLGSSTSVVAFQAAAGPCELLALPPYSLDHPVVVPSLLWLNPEAPPGTQALIGRQVLEAGLDQSDDPALRRDFKREIGTGGPRGHAAEQAGAHLLQSLWRALPSNLQPQRLVLTAPIDSYPAYRQWLAGVCEDLSVAEVALVDEPTAAAIGAGLAPGSTALVVDIGGGTVDLALVKLQGGEGRAAPIAQLLRFAGRTLAGSGQALRCAEVIGKAGLACGGRDIDRWIAAELWPDQPLKAPMLELAERLKCQLSSQEEAMALLALANKPPTAWHLSRQRFEALLEQRGLMHQLDELLEQVLAAGRRAGISPQQITAVLPVGGSSRIPLVRRWLEQRLPSVPCSGDRPVEAVALGALALTPGVQLKDVLSQGVALRCWEQRSNRHLWHPLYVAGQSWPTERPLDIVLSCSRDGQQALELVLGQPQQEHRGEVVFEGDLPVLRSRPAGHDPVVAWSQQPAAIALNPAGIRGVDRLKLAFAIEANGQLTVEITDLASGANLGQRVLGCVH